MFLLVQQSGFYCHVPIRNFSQISEVYICSNLSHLTWVLKPIALNIPRLRRVKIHGNHYHVLISV